MNQPLDTEPTIRRRFSAILAEKLVRNAVMVIQMGDTPVTRELVTQTVKMVADLRAVPDSVHESRLAVETINATLKELDAGGWDERIETYRAGG